VGQRGLVQQAMGQVGAVYSAADDQHLEHCELSSLMRPSTMAFVAKVVEKSIFRTTSALPKGKYRHRRNPYCISKQNAILLHQ
jgi:hypothetical protein